MLKIIRSLLSDFSEATVLAGIVIDLGRDPYEPVKLLRLGLKWDLGAGVKQ